MKIYSGYPGGITKITNGKDFYQTEDLSNVITVYVDKTNLTGITYTLILEFLRADNRKTTLIPQAFEVGDDTTLIEDGVTYDIHNFTLTETQLAVAGALAFTCYINILNNGVVEKRGVLFNAVSNVRKTVTYSANTIFVVSDDEDDVPIIVADMKTAIETLAGQLASKVNKADVADNLTTNDSDKVLSAKQGYILKALLDALEAAKADKSTTYTKTEDDALLDLKADKSNTYTIPETNTLLAGKQNTLTFDSTPTANSTNPVTSGGVKTALDAKADKSDTYTRNVTDAFIAYLETNKANKNEVYNKTEMDTTTNQIFNMLYLVEGAIDKLESVQNVVDVVATKSALNSYDTSKLEENDKIQVIADETHDGASTIYNWNGSALQYVGAYGTNSYTKPETLEQIDSHKLINKTYAELQTMKTNGTLVAGQLYRITDYVTKTNGKCNNIANDVRSTEYPFDIILRAISTTEFSEQARAIWHSGDTYFANSELQAWKLWYCFDNDSVRFEWADTTTGKGVIYRMIDEFGNDLPYDFKNIQFKRYKITATSDPRQSNAVGSYYGFNGNYSCTSDSTDYSWFYTFTKRADGSDLSLTQTLGGSWQNCYYVKQMIIREYLTDNPNYRGSQALNNIVFECTNIMVDVQMGAGSHHATVIGYKDLTYIYFKEMFRYNILYGEMSHLRADECFEQNMIGDFTDLSTDCAHWCKFTHHFGSNTAIHLTYNDFESRVTNTKFPERFIRNHVFNLWDSVNMVTHTAFINCDLGYMVNVTLSGTGDWNGVRTISCFNVTIKITNLYGSNFGRMEYVSIGQGNNSFNVLNLTVGAIFGTSSAILSIDINDLVEIGTTYQKSIDFACNTATDGRCLIYTYSIYNAESNMFDKGGLFGTIASDGSVTWSAVDTLNTKFNNVAIEMDRMNRDLTNLKVATEGNLYNETDANGIAYEVALSNPLPYGKVNKVGGMSYKSENLLQLSDETKTVSSVTFTIQNGKISSSGTPTNTEWIKIKEFTLNAGTYSYADLTTNTSKVYLVTSNYVQLATTFTLSETTTIFIGKTGNDIINNGNVSNSMPMLVLGSTVPTTWSEGFTGIRNTAVSQLTIKGENLLQLSDVAETTTNGVTYKVENGVITLNGTATSGVNIFLDINEIILNGDYYYKEFSSVAGVSRALRYGTTTNVQNLNNTISFSQTNATVNKYLLYIAIGTTITNGVIQPMLVSGSTAPTEYKPYVTPIIKTIPSEIQALTGYGWGLTQSASDYLYYPNKKYVQAVNRVKAKDLNWFDSQANVGFFQVGVSNIKKPSSNGEIGNILSNNYTSDTANNIYAGTTDKTIGINANNGYIQVRDNSYTNATDFKNHFTDDDYIYFELATPIETDVSQYLTDENYDVLPNLEPNGSITLDNIYQQEAVYDITTLEKVSV